MCGEPHGFVGQCQIAASLYDDDPLDRIKLGFEVRVLLEAFSLAHRHVESQVNLSRLDGSDTRRWVLDDLERDVLHFRFRAPIGLVPLQYDAAVELVVNQFVRAGADRRLCEPILADLLEIILRHDIAAKKS